MATASDGSSSKTCPRCHRAYPRDYSVCTEDGTALRGLEEWRPGDVIGGKFRVLEKIGQGSTGTVYKAELVATQELRALKLFFPSIARRPALVHHLRDAVRSTRAFHHPGAVQVEEVHHDEPEALVLVMEYAAGESLEHVIRRNGPLPVPRAADIVRQLCSVLEGAHHHGLIHGNLHPGNVLLNLQPEPPDFVKVRDFGMAEFREAVAEAGIVVSGATKTKTGFIGGTPQYMSPEQALGKGGVPLDGRSDVYSVGVLMYEALIGELPFSANTPQGLMLHHIHTRPASPLKRRADLKLPEALVEIAMRALEKNPALRFESAGKMAAALEEFQEAQPRRAAGIEPLRQPSLGGVPSGLRPPAPAATQLTPPAFPLPVDEEEPGPDSAYLPFVDLDDVLEEAPLPAPTETTGGSTFEAMTVEVGPPRPQRPAERAERAEQSGWMNPLLSPGLADLDLGESSPAAPLSNEEDAGAIDAVLLPEVAGKPPRAEETKLEEERVAEPPGAVPLESQAGARSRTEQALEQRAGQPTTRVGPTMPTAPTVKARPLGVPSQTRPTAADVIVTAQPVERGQKLSPALRAPAEPPSSRPLQEPRKPSASRTPAEPLLARRSALGLSITQVTDGQVEPQAGKHRARIAVIAAAVILCAAAGTWWVLQKSRHASSEPEPSEEAVSTPAPNPPPPVANPSTAAETPAASAPKETAPAAISASPAPLASPPATAPRSAKALTSARAAVTVRAKNGQLHTPQARLPAPSTSARTSAPASRSGSKVPTVVAHSRPANSAATASAPRAVRTLSPAQQADLKDKLVVAGFLMKRGDYDGALDAFEGALKIDPANRDAQAGKEKARRARDAQKTNVQ